jgi:hypothetical protein
VDGRIYEGREKERWSGPSFDSDSTLVGSVGLELDYPDPDPDPDPAHRVRRGFVSGPFLFSVDRML